MELPLVSVVVPVHNTELFLAKCIESILCQSYKNIQLVLVDDCSSDNSRIICEKYKQKDERVKFIHCNDHEGVSKTRNLGIKNSDGRYICFVDSDDFLETKYVEKYKELLKKYNTHVVYGRHKYYQDGKMLKRPMRIGEGYYKVSELSSRLIDDGTVTGVLFGSACGAMYDLKFIKDNELKFDEKLKKNEDGVFNLDLLAICKELYITTYDGYCYRKWKENIRFPLFAPDNELEKATAIIGQRHSNLKDFTRQMQRRNVSVIFWNAIKIGQCLESASKSCHRLRIYLDESFRNEDYRSLEKDAMSISKRLLVFLLYKRYVLLFYCLIRYLYPIMRCFR